MFYPVESLKRGGRFYLCWVADSWPLRFAAITHRQLWSQDIRKLCDDLLEVMTNESGRPNNRFSLRLSSQLMRGLVRLYERKVTVLLSDLCMINATVFKSANKKSEAPHERTARRLPQLRPTAAVVEEPDNEQRVEEMIQNSGNVVVNIQDITLKEAAIPEFQLPPNDNFGEENPDQNLQSLLGERTIEMMMHESHALQVSGPQAGAEAQGSELDVSRPALPEPQAERAEHMDVTLFNKSAGGDLPVFDKDVPEIPEILLPVPDLPVPTEPIPPEPQPIEQQDKEVLPQEEEAEVVPPVPEQPLEAPPPPQPPVDIQLEELEEQPAAKRRRVRSKLIIDKNIRIGPDVLRARIDNPLVDCLPYSEIEIRVPAKMLLLEPAQRGTGLFTGMSPRLQECFRTRLGTLLIDRHAAHSETETEQPRVLRSRPSRTELERIAEVDEQQIEAPQISIPEIETTRRVTEGPSEMIDVMNQTRNVLNVTGLEVPDVEMQQLNVQVDISDLPTQKLETLSQMARKRTSELETPPKRLRSGYMSFRESQQQRSLQPPEIIIDAPDKENIPPNVQEQPTIQQSLPLDQSVASRMLKEAGLSDVQQYPVETQEEPVVVEKQVESQRRRKTGSDSSETPLGSLDRTKVSLGDSIKTTDSQRFIRTEFGIEGTMTKIMTAVRAGGPVTVARLVTAAPPLAGHRARMAARCFTSILKLKQHEFIRIVKDPETLEILDILLGSKFDNM